jgi:hypothetical protein
MAPPVEPPADPLDEVRVALRALQDQLAFFGLIVVIDFLLTVFLILAYVGGGWGR